MLPFRVSPFLRSILTRCPVAVSWAPMAPSKPPVVAAEAGPHNFIRDIVAADVEAKRYGGKVRTRFPPEPNGYLHIGHAKSIYLNFTTARDFGGLCHLRMDDTNPTTEDPEYVASIQNDVKWLGFDWGPNFFHASDYFERMYQDGVGLIKKGLAYVCSLSEEDMRAYRGTVTEPGKPSPDRDRPVAENLELFSKMRRGELPDGSYTLRAKIDMSASNMKMRDPPLYRIRHASHHRTGNDWPIYPMYDYAHCLSDAYEGITHSICTLEFENNRELYDWIINAVDTPHKPHQYEFARLRITHVVLSKRKLLQLVKQKRVAGWDDPRMPTIAGLRRRGVRPQALHALCEKVGVAKANSTVELELLEHCIREDLNAEAPRVLGVLDPLKVVIENYPAGKSEDLDASYWPQDVPKEGSRKVPFGKTLYIERDDFMEEPSKQFFRLAPGREVRLRYGYIIKCERVVKDAAGKVTELVCSYDPDTKGGNPKDGRKVKGTIHWVSAEHAVDAEVRIYDRLFAHDKPDEVEDFLSCLNPDSLKSVRAKLEPSLQTAKAGQHFQLERHGYFFVDPVDSKPGAPVLNKVVSLKDTWAKIAARDEEGDKPHKASEARASDAPKVAAKKAAPGEGLSAEQLADFAHFQKLGVPAAEADGVARLSARAFVEAALSGHKNARRVASFITNELVAAVGDGGLSGLRFGGKEIGRLVQLVDDGTLSTKLAKDVLAAMLAEGGDPDAVVAKKGYKQIHDAGAVLQVVEKVLGEQKDAVEKYRAGKTNVMGFLVGQVIRATGGQAKPDLVEQLVKQRLG